VPNKIFVGGVPITVTEEQFRQCFAAYGTITKVELHALRGFGYITYDTVEAVDACLEKYEEHYLSKKWVEVKRSIPRELIDAYEREQRRLQHLHEPSSSPTKAKEVAASPKSAAPSASPAGGKGVPGAAGARPAGPTAAPPRAAAARPAAGSSGNLQRTMTSSSIASSQGGYPGAPATPAGHVGRIAQLKEMGFSDEVARKVLTECAWDVNKAIDRLLLTGVPDTEGDTGGSDKGAEKEKIAEDEDTGANGKAFFPEKETVQETEATESPPENGGAPLPAEATEAASSGASQEPAQTEVVQQPAPTKRLERVTKPWTAGDTSQLGVVEDEFVYVWAETGTENGWIHAELASNQAKVGWLPQCILRELPEGQRWMRAKTKWQARDDTQCSVEVGEFCLVWVSSLTKEGWTYVECQDSADKGWLPDFCLAWSDP